MGGLHPTQPASVRIGAVRAVFGFCDHLKTTGNIQLLAPYLDNILEGLVTVATQFSSEVLGLCLETLSVVVTVMRWIGVISRWVGGSSVSRVSKGTISKQSNCYRRSSVSRVQKRTPGKGGHC